MGEEAVAIGEEEEEEEVTSSSPKDFLLRPQPISNRVQRRKKTADEDYCLFLYCLCGEEGGGGGERKS